jgi:DNA (cytosine-5)-methyltransferase 1
MQTYDTTEVGVRSNKGAPRIWLENQRMARAGFEPGARYNLTVGDQRVVLTVNADGSRTVTGHKKGERTIPVIDINSAAALGAFAGLERVRVVFRASEIHILPLASQKKAAERLERIERKLRAGEPLRSGSLCHGGGILAKALHDGMEMAGVKTKLVMANDIEGGVLNHAAEVNPVWDDETIAVSAPMQELVTDAYFMRQVGTLDVLDAGLPCVGASTAGRSKKHLSMAEADTNVGHLVVSFLMMIEAWNPALIILENVVPYLNTASMFIIRNTLRDWGFVVHETVLEARNFGCLEDRKRACIVAVTQGLHFEMESIEQPGPSGKKLGEILDPTIGPHSDLWSEYEYLRRKEASDIAAGKGFRRQILGPDADRVGTIGAGYAKVRSTEAQVAHPDPNDTRSRLLTPHEHARAKGVDESLIAGLSATRAHHMLGNGICPPPFLATGVAIGRALMAHLTAPARTPATDTRTLAQTTGMQDADLFMSQAA